MGLRDHAFVARNVAWAAVALTGCAAVVAPPAPRAEDAAADAPTDAATTDVVDVASDGAADVGTDGVPDGAVCAGIDVYDIHSPLMKPSPCRDGEFHWACRRRWCIPPDGCLAFPTDCPCSPCDCARRVVTCPGSFNCTRVDYRYYIMGCY